jgi:hypothetical protein
MRRATITIPNDLEVELDRYLARQAAPPSLTVVVQAALRSFLREQRLAALEFQAPSAPLTITPASRGSGKADVSREHDRYLADDP